MCALRGPPGSSLFVDTLSVSGHDVCGFVCIVSSPDPSGSMFHAQVYHGDEDGVAHITQRQRKTRAGECIIVIREQLTVAHTTQLKAIMKLPSLAWSSLYGLFLSLSSLRIFLSALWPLSPFHCMLAPYGLRLAD